MEVLQNPARLLSTGMRYGEKSVYFSHLKRIHCSAVTEHVAVQTATI